MEFDRGKRLWTRICMALLAVYVALFAFNAMTRTREFDDPDTMNFVDVARHIVVGQGIRQATLGFNQPVFAIDDAIPTPLTHQPPLYPLTLAALARTGLSVTDAALAISVIAYGLVLLGTYFIAARLFGRPEGLAAVLLLALYAPLRDFSDSAFSESMGLALMFACVGLLTRYAATPGGRQPLLPILAGCLAASAVATRYALAPLVIAGAWFVFVEDGWRVRNVMLFLVAPAITALVLAGRNLEILHGSLAPHYLASTSGYLKNLRSTLASLSSDYADWASAPVRFALLMAALGVICFIAWRAHRLRSAIASVAFRRPGANLLTMFVVLYVAFLIMQRSHSYIDAIGARYLLPASVVLVLLFAAFAVRALDIGERSLSMAGAVIALGMIGFQTYTAIVTPPYDPQRLIDSSERLHWVEDHTTSSDLIIGEDTADIAFYFQRPAVSYSPFPYTETLPYSKLLGLCRRFQPEYRRILLIPRLHPDLDSSRWLVRLGPFIQSATAGRLADYPQLTPVATLGDARVFEVNCAHPPVAEAARKN